MRRGIRPIPTFFLAGAEYLFHAIIPHVNAAPLPIFPLNGQPDPLHSRPGLFPQGCISAGVSLELRAPLPDP